MGFSAFLFLAGKMEFSAKAYRRFFEVDNIINELIKYR
jgi:hypothetical protein